MNFEEAFEHQRIMQRDVFGNDVSEMDSKSRGAWIGLNVLAATDELHELLKECPAWKPWASTDEINRSAAIGEAVDAMHFFLNILDAIGVEPDEFWEAFKEKQLRNIKRQMAGYTGQSRCAGCGRAWDDIDKHRGDTNGKASRFVVTTNDDRVHIYCSRMCFTDHASVDAVYKDMRQVDAVTDDDKWRPGDK